MKKLVAIVYLLNCVTLGYALTPGVSFLLVGDTRGDVKVNQKRAMIGDTIGLTDVLVIGDAFGSSAKVVSPEGKFEEVSIAGKYNFERLAKQIQAKVAKPWYSKLWTFVISKAVEHHEESMLDNISGSTEKSVSGYFPIQWALLLTDTITFSWINLTGSGEAQYILADTVYLVDENNLYLNQILDTSIRTDQISINFSERGLLPGKLYYWCVNYKDEKQYRFKVLYYVHPNERAFVRDVLNDIALDKDSKDVQKLKEVFVQSFFAVVKPFPY